MGPGSAVLLQEEVQQGKPCRRWLGSSMVSCQLGKVHLWRRTERGVDFFCIVVVLTIPKRSAVAPGALQMYHERQTALVPRCLQAKTEEGEVEARTGGENIFFRICSNCLMHIISVLNHCSQRCIRARVCTDI